MKLAAAAQFFFPAYLSEQSVLVMPDGNVLVLCSVGDDLDEAADLRLGVERHAEQLCKTRQETFNIIKNKECRKRDIRQLGCKQESTRILTPSYYIHF